MTCPEFLAFIDRYTPDTTTRADQWVAFQHRESCEPCRLELTRRSELGRREMDAAQRAKAKIEGFFQAVEIINDPEAMG